VVKFIRVFISCISRIPRFGLLSSSVFSLRSSLRSGGGFGCFGEATGEVCACAPRCVWRRWWFGVWWRCGDCEGVSFWLIVNRELLDAFLGGVCLPVGNGRYSRLAVCATSVTPIANRLYRGLPVRLGFGVFRLASAPRERKMVEPCERDAFIWHWLASES